MSRRPIAIAPAPSPSAAASSSPAAHSLDAQPALQRAHGTRAAGPHAELAQHAGQQQRQDQSEQQQQSLGTMSGAKQQPNHGKLDQDGQPKPKRQRRNKVAEACRFCRRSHMSCDANRPCTRCVKRNIAHLCSDDPPASAAGSGAGGGASAGNSATTASTKLPSSSRAASATAAAAAGLPSTSSAASDLLPPSSVAPGSSSQLPQHLQHDHSALGLDIERVQDNGHHHHASQISPAAQQQHQPVLSAAPNFGVNNLFDYAASAAAGTSNAGAALEGMQSLSFDDLLAGTKHSDGEFYGLGLGDFLRSLNDDATYLDTANHPALASGSSSFTPLPPQQQQQQVQQQHQDIMDRVNQMASQADDPSAGLLEDAPPNQQQQQQQQQQKGAAGGDTGTGASSRQHSAPTSPLNKTDRFFLTAADQKDGSRSDRLARVIHAKFEAGLLRPYNHVAGYTRLMRWMADHMSPTSRQRTLKTLSEFRPAFRAIASGLTDLDLVFIEEAFERLLLDYDRVFSSMGIPSCLWRRTGEIYKGNQEFADLVGVSIDQLKEGKLAIYELMGEESAVNYWEKYGNIAFDAGQKAVLTSCVLVNQAILARNKKRRRREKRHGRHHSSRHGKQRATDAPDGVEEEESGHRAMEDPYINCCFSFTVRRDSYAIPSMIVGNFLRF